MGGICGLWQTRIPLEGCGAVVFPDMFALPHAHQAFDDGGYLRDPVLVERLEREVVGFVRFAQAVAPIYARDVKGRLKALQREIAAALEEETELQPEPPRAAGQ